MFVTKDNFVNIFCRSLLLLKFCPNIRQHENTSTCWVSGWSKRLRYGRIVGWDYPTFPSSDKNYSFTWNGVFDAFLVIIFLCAHRQKMLNFPPHGMSAPKKCFLTIISVQSPAPPPKKKSGTSGHGIHMTSDWDRCEQNDPTKKITSGLIESYFSTRPVCNCVR